VDATTDGTPIFRELSLPGWLVAINGRQVVELSGYSPFQAVPLPAGNATVRFSYLPPGETAAEVASLISAVLLIVGWLREALSAKPSRGR